MEVVEENNRCCVGCLCTEEELELQHYSIQLEPLKAIFQVNTLLLCYLCKKLAQHAELFVQNVQSNQMLLENFHGDLSPLQSVRGQVQTSITLTHATLPPINLSGTGDEESCSVIVSNYLKIKLELKEEGLDHLEGEFIDDDDFQNSFVKDEDYSQDNILKEEVESDGIDLKSLRKTLKRKKVKKKDGRVRKRIIKINKHSDSHRQIILVKKSLPAFESSNDYILMRITEKQCVEEREQMAQDKTYLDSPYKCVDCLKGFMLRDSYDRHMEKHSLSRGSYCCKICKLRFETAPNLAGHKRGHTQRYKCLKCELTRVSQKAIKEHLSNKHNTHDTEYSCSKCTKIFKRQTSLRKHELYSHSLKDRVTCEICEKSFVSKESLQSHLLRKHSSEGTKRYVCQECGLAFLAPSQLRYHAVAHSDHRPFYCVECDKSFKTAAILAHHLNTTSPHINYSDLPLACSDCDKRFAIKRDLVRHTNRVHLNHKPYQCDKCDRAYINNWSLREHKMYSHDGAKRPLRYPCSMCDKVFDRNSILKSHMRTHTGERPYQCSRCPAQFAQGSALGTHVKLVHLKLTRDGRPKSSSLKKNPDSGYKMKAKNVKCKIRITLRPIKRKCCHINNGCRVHNKIATLK